MWKTCAPANMQTNTNIQCHLETFQAWTMNFGDSPCIFRN